MNATKEQTIRQLTNMSLSEIESIRDTLADFIEPPQVLPDHQATKAMYLHQAWGNFKNLKGDFQLLGIEYNSENPLHFELQETFYFVECLLNLYQRSK